MEITNKLDPGFTALAMSLFSGVNAWLMDSTATQPAEAQGDGGQGVQLRGEEGEGMGGGGRGGPESPYAAPQDVLQALSPKYHWHPSSFLHPCCHHPGPSHP